MHILLSAKKKIFFSKELLAIICLLLMLTITFVVIQRIKISPKFQADISYAQIPNATISYYIRGSGDPIILLSGFGMTMQDWDPGLLKKLTTNHELIILDFRGIGASTGQLDGLTEQQIAADVVATMDTLQLKKAHIIGWSLGSFVGQLIAEKYPQRVNKLILISTAPGQEQQIQSSTDVGDRIQNNLGGSWENVYVPSLFYSDNARKEYLTRLQNAQIHKELPVVPEETIDAKLAYEKAFAQPKAELDRTTSLSTIKAPTLLITGKQDTLLVPENAQRVVNRIPYANLILVPQAGHGVLFEKADEVSRIIETFLKEK